jgi:hypothetical protein
LKRDPFEPRLRTLRQLYDSITKEPLPERFKELLDQLK